MNKNEFIEQLYIAAKFLCRQSEIMLRVTSISGAKRIGKIYQKGSLAAVDLDHFHEEKICTSFILMYNLINICKNKLLRM
jgi:hypothetical protein